MPSMKLALFDFDGTITNKDTYTEFLFSVSSRSRISLGLLIASPVILAYKLGWLPASKTRPILSRVTFWRRCCHQVQRGADNYVTHTLANHIRPEMLEKIEWHQSQGHRVVVVSANLDILIKTWCSKYNLEWVCSELEVTQGRYSGRYLKGDCSHENKVHFLKQHLDLDLYQYVYAYGDTEEDYPLLSLANEAFFKGKPYTCR
ncbi:HAD family hydrolase [Vibrio sonorensis]|uniref:HAD family hydrolase n=1 Tax=Vibrio sonorensis TaxID=1004316 RepID=UPI001FDF9FCC|nr:HAD family hydrolase [Vibrio sonorensis]